jgi:hypothetical protein
MYISKALDSLLFFFILEFTVYKNDDKRISLNDKIGPYKQIPDEWFGRKKWIKVTGYHGH